MLRSTAAPRPLPRRILDAFIAPRRMAAGFRDHSPVFGALLVTTLAAVAAAAALPDSYYLDQAENPVNRLGRPVTITSPPSEIVRWGRSLQMFSAAVEHPVIVFTLAGLVTLVFTVIGGGHVSMRQYLALTAHAFVISSLGVLVTVGWHLLSGDADAQPSLALLVGRAGGASGPLWLRSLELLNPFTLWMLAVLAIGVSELDPRRSFASAGTILLGLYVALAASIASLG